MYMILNKRNLIRNLMIFEREILYSVCIFYSNKNCSSTQFFFQYEYITDIYFYIFQAGKLESVILFLSTYLRYRYISCCWDFLNITKVLITCMILYVHC